MRKGTKLDIEIALWQKCEGNGRSASKYFIKGNGKHGKKY